MDGRYHGRGSNILCLVLVPDYVNLRRLHLVGRAETVLFLISTTGQLIAEASLEIDGEVLLQLKVFLQENNRVNQGQYAQWGKTELSPCSWSGITCNRANSSVSGINLSDSGISGRIFRNFSALPELSALDLSKNTLDGAIPDDLSQCKNLRFLNLSNNILAGELNLRGLTNLEVLDVTGNRLQGGIQSNFPTLCSRLIVANLSSNNLTGGILNCFDQCWKLQVLDLSANQFTGPIWPGFARLRDFSVSENNLTGDVSPALFPTNCSLQSLDLSVNEFQGEFPKQVSNCIAMTSLNLWGNGFGGKIPPEIGNLSSLEVFNMGNNKISSEIPEELVNCRNLSFLDLGKNGFGGDIQKIFGRFEQVEFLVLSGNSYTGGITESGILKLPKVIRLNLSNNQFSGQLPVEIFQMASLKFLILAENRFNGSIPPQFGGLSNLQALDLSSNDLTGTIPPTIGNMTSLLWLMLARNRLTGAIPREIGNCSSLLWLNLADNRFVGKIPEELSRIGRNPNPTFDYNRRNPQTLAATGECRIMKSWIPADYPPFSFVYTLLTRKRCRILWWQLLTGTGLFPVCRGTPAVRKYEITGYLQLTGNRFSGELPQEIGEMQNFSLLQMGFNHFTGRLPSTIGRLPLVILNVSNNAFSGPIPSELGAITCLQNLDLSRNDFSGEFPATLADLHELSLFNVSYNPSIYGMVPTAGQMGTFDDNSFLGNPKLIISNGNPGNAPKIPGEGRWHAEPKTPPPRVYVILLVLALAFLVFGGLSFVVCISLRNSSSSARLLLEESKRRHDDMASSLAGDSASELYYKVFHLGKTPFSYHDIMKATRCFSENMVIGKGGFGKVYQGVLPDGRKVAVKKLLSEGAEGEREFKNEMEVLSGGGNCSGSPHPNLVALFGWCLFGPEKLLVYEFMEGGTLEDLVSDWKKLGWRKRVEIAVGVARALVFLHHECFPAVVHRDVKASNVLLDKEGRPRVTDFGLARVVRPGDSHVSTVIAGTIGYVAPEYGQTWRATTKGDVYSFGVLAMELATGRRAVDNGEECLVEWVKRVASQGHDGLKGAVVPLLMSWVDVEEGLREMCELLRVGLRCTAEAPQARPDMKEVLGMLVRITGDKDDYGALCHSPPLLTVSYA
ncbi:hypothetical protein ACLOJK_000812 [Asimina triloba]